MRTPNLGSVFYSPSPTPLEVKELGRFVTEELFKLSVAIDLLSQGHLDKVNVAPVKPRDGDIRYADGTNWNPGYGIGLYQVQGTTYIPITRAGHLTAIVTNAAATYTVLTTDGTIIQTTAASVYTLPAAASYTGRILHLVTQFAGTVTSASSNVVPIAGGAAGTGILAATAGKFATLQSNGTDWVIVAAN